MRVIIRFSIDNEANSALRNQLALVLTSDGFVKHPSRTATYEHRSISMQLLRTAMDRFWRQAENPPNQAEIDHIWIYVDKNPSLD